MGERSSKNKLVMAIAGGSCRWLMFMIRCILPCRPICLALLPDNFRPQLNVSRTAGTDDGIGGLNIWSRGGETKGDRRRKVAADRSGREVCVIRNIEHLA